MPMPAFPVAAPRILRGVAIPVALGFLFAVPIPPAAAVSPSGEWSRLTPDTRWSHTLVYDAARDRLVSFGGWDGLRNTNDLRVLGLAGAQGWQTMATAGAAPPVRSRHTMVLDTARDRLVVFGGWGAHPTGNDVWALPLGGDAAWTELDPSGPLPEGRIEHCAIYDPVRDRMLVFGGIAQDATVWSLSFAGEAAWTPLVTAGDPPPAHEGCSAIYDPVGDRMLLFGGADNDGILYNLVWSLSLGPTPTWSVVPFGSVYPWSRFGHSAVYDAEDHRMVIFGGRDDGGVRNDAWSLSLVGAPAWTGLAVAPAAVTPRQWHGAAWDMLRDRMLVTGGWSENGPLGDVVALDLAGAAGWSVLDVAGEFPPPRDGHVAVLDSHRDRMLVFGGGYDDPDPQFVWGLSLTGPARWQKLAAGGDPPGWRFAAAAVFDPVRDRMLLIGGQSTTEAENDVRALDLDGEQWWTLLAPAGTPPTPRVGHSAVYDPLGDRVLLFGGADGGGLRNDVWQLSLAGAPAWTRLSPEGSAPAPRYVHAAVLDPAGNRMIVFGGLAALTGLANDVWALSLGASPAWSQIITPANRPSGREGPTAVFDVARERMVVVGGWDGVRALQDAWALELGGESPEWSWLSPPWPWPRGRWMHTAVHDPLGDRMVVFGGHDGSAPLGDLWTLHWREPVAVAPEPVVAAPGALALAPPSPNPARGDVRLEFALPDAGRASVAVFDLSGRLLRTVADGRFDVGRHALAWDRRDAQGREVPAGIYFVRLVAGDVRLTRKLVLLP